MFQAPRGGYLPANPSRCRAKTRTASLSASKTAWILQWDYDGPFGFAAVLAQADEPPRSVGEVTAEELIKKEVALFGSPTEVAEKIMRTRIARLQKISCSILGLRWAVSLGEEIEEQMQYFAEEVLPLLARACGGQVQTPSWDWPSTRIKRRR